MQGFENTMFPFSCLAFGMFISALLSLLEFVAGKTVGRRKVPMDAAADNRRRERLLAEVNGIFSGMSNLEIEESLKKLGSWAMKVSHII